jgi:hypothetical protein
MRLIFKVARPASNSIAAGRPARRQKRETMAIRVLIGVIAGLLVAIGAIPSSAADMTDERAP